MSEQKQSIDERLKALKAEGRKAFADLRAGRKKKITMRQLLANRENAKKSTGPKTSHGKAAASNNATKHGLLALENVLDGESRRKFNVLERAMMTELAPEGEMERILVSRIVTLVWRLRRVANVEQDMMRAHLADERERLNRYRQPDEQVEATLGEVFAHVARWDDAYSKFRRYEAHIERALFRALHELQRLQAARKGREVSAPAIIDVDVNVNTEAA